MRTKLTLLATGAAAAAMALLPKAVFALSLETAFVTGVTTAPLGEIVGNITNIVLTILGIIAFVIILFAGFRWMTSGGNEESVSSAKKMMAAGVIGLIIVLAAAAISNFIVGQLVGTFGT